MKNESGSMKNELKTPPPFVRCDECGGSGVYWVNFYKAIKEVCHKCKDSPLPGWIPQYYTPEQYRDWIRRENGLPEYELPPDTKIYVKSKEGSRSWYLTGTMWEYTADNRFDPRYYWVVIDAISGRPPEDWRPE